MSKATVTVSIAVNEKSHTVLITYVDGRGLVVAQRRVVVRQGPGGARRTVERLAEGVRQALEFAEPELSWD